MLSLVTLQSILPFWLDRGPGLSAGEQTLVLLTVFLSTIGSLPIWASIARRLCKLRCLAIGLAVFLSGLAIALALPVGAGQSVGLFVAAGLAGVGAGALSMCPWAMIPDVAEAHARRLGAAVEGTTSAAFTMTNKMAAASALFLNSATLAVISADTGPAAAPFTLLLLPMALGAATAAGAILILLSHRNPMARNKSGLGG